MIGLNNKRLAANQNGATPGWIPSFKCLKQIESPAAKNEATKAIIDPLKY